MDQATPARAESSIAKPEVPMLRSWVTGRRGLLTLALIGVTGGMYLNWDWLVAAGAAPVILAILPCAAMCALGLCHRKSAQTADCCDTLVQRKLAERNRGNAPAPEDGAGHSSGR